MKHFLVYGLSNNWGGVEAIVMAMIKRLAGEYDFTIIHSPGSSTYEKKFESDYVHFVHIPTWGADRKGFISAIKDILSTKAFDYVWVNACIMANRSIISVVRKYSDAKIITHSHGSSFEETNKIKRFVLLALHRLNKWFYFRNIDFPCMCSQKSGVWFYGNQYLNSHTVHLVKNGVDVSKYRYDFQARFECRKKFGINDEMLLFHAGRLTEVKNQRKILRIVSDALAEGMKIKLIIAGDGELRHPLEEYANELGIQESVIFLGYQNDITNLYQAADVMLLPSFHEGFPVTLAEAQTSGLPCLVSDRVSVETNIIGLVKFISIDDSNNSVWISALKGLHTDNFDRSLAADKVSEAGYSIERVCEDFTSFLGCNRICL